MDNLEDKVKKEEESTKQLFENYDNYSIDLKYTESLRSFLCGRCHMKFDLNNENKYITHIKECDAENYMIYEDKIKAIKNLYQNAINEFKLEIEVKKSEVDTKIEEYEKIYERQKKDIMDIIKSSGLKNQIDQKLVNFVFYPDCMAIYYCKGLKNGCKAKKNVWGDNPYTFDSEICKAALNSGVIDVEGGIFEVTKGDYLNEFKACNKNGILTLNFGRSTQIKITPPKTELLELILPNDNSNNNFKGKFCGRLLGCCRGKNNGCLNFGNYKDVWGDNPYSGDSNLCNAALNASVISKTGGIFFVEEIGPKDSFKSSFRNDIQTLNWGSFENSFLIKKF